MFADLLICGSAPEVFRLSLSEGRFLTPLSTRSPAANACSVSAAHGERLLAQHADFCQRQTPTLIVSCNASSTNHVFVLAKLSVMSLNIQANGHCSFLCMNLPH